MPDFPKNPIPSMKEDHISQIPALQLLQNIGYTYLTPIEADAARNNRKGNVVLENILVEQLRKINVIKYKGGAFPFTDGNIIDALHTLTSVMDNGLLKTNEQIYDLLCLGKGLPQVIAGDIKSFQLYYIDWNNWENNVFHVTEEYSVERTGSNETRRPDIVLFVNGIPLAVIECKRPDMKDPIGEAISQHIRNQKDYEIPKLFHYAQLLIAVSKNEAKYGTVGTIPKFWSVWKEQEYVEEDIYRAISQIPSPEQKDRLFEDRFHYIRAYFDAIEAKGRQITEQDHALFNLCRRERLLEFVYRFMLFDSGEKKIARHQQYFCVRKTMNRIRKVQPDGSRQGGVIWHTQGSGKSLTMVMLAEALALETGLNNYKIVLVTDRVDLDDQIYKVFLHCGSAPVQAKTGKHLAELLMENKSTIITTVIDKFEAAVAKSARNENPNIFVLVDESHRGQFGELHAKMKKAIPNGCFMGFTGTPVMKDDRNTIFRFGGLIDTYTITDAVKDKAVVPLLYEGRHVEQNVDKEAIDSWFARITENLTPAQRADLKKKFSTTDQLNKAEQKVKRVAYDISVHYRDAWQGTPYKAQLVAQDKAAALLYKKYLDEFGMVSSEVLISGPDDREGEDDPHGDTKEEVKLFWKRMMSKYGTDREYNRQLINAFKNSEQPEIIIVVDKLLTGFDAPRNTVLYLTRMLKDHTLLQAIARVNRLHDGKDFGYIIDYRGVLENLDKALDIYGKLSAFEDEGLDDLCNALADIEVEVAKLSQRYSDLWDIFKTIDNKRDEEAYERLLADEAIREKFYERLSVYARTLGIAIASQKFIDKTPEKIVEKYKADLRFFMQLRTSVRRRYAEVVDFKEYETRIQKLLDTHVGTGEVEKLTNLVNIFDADTFAKEVEKQGSTASKADTIAYRTKKTISEKMAEDPAFYKKFSELLEAAIRAFRQQRLTDAEYLAKVTEISEKIRTRSGDEIPKELENLEVAKAFYGVLLEVFASHVAEKSDARKIGADAGIQIDKLIKEKMIVNWTSNQDIQNQMKLAIEDYLFDLKEKNSISLSFEEIDTLLDTVLDIARVRYPE
ncbi:MAG: restriction endonuclease subunit R [Candidatus Raymondbacteria bacterium RifOxyA12_full_50_37]|uniref:Type I restriction enzyme endonuclease subunit n=1 Tax=Candidatus Raymondbacteria bacterium RIFOXYD12_FULL_49_13 TaxID=1817890 RepID=A0A1F7FFS6_UNCRA|nr:MAG: restriction endonuclease subunit R [Candidatus Raymondbacteria bacterium RifOxyA12_full_50_37]OGJ94296.1 MAG: restriction endonuclease subunit R [Candidatus Raymondbacteria bacterium RIFOXYA2_FULL_49_16]OGJ96394.1 MAG: restriction endonuclease subunit R [Candidatus Raymondbacteria bacterium RifOxyC12_full_50_8]OGJ99126.1 MAG: restriction endonuclease subunit R [Candidatus Raymondbacteria bacterium RIFOXYC2_FULL_50_21]OGK01209.1 MAG: restriction endonuclease subunit R [Candidatus Raymond